MERHIRRQCHCQSDHRQTPECRGHQPLGSAAVALSVGFRQHIDERVAPEAEVRDGKPAYSAAHRQPDSISFRSQIPNSERDGNQIRRHREALRQDRSDSGHAGTAYAHRAPVFLVSDCPLQQRLCPVWNTLPYQKKKGASELFRVKSCLCCPIQKICAATASGNSRRLL